MESQVGVRGAPCCPGHLGLGPLPTTAQSRVSRSIRQLAAGDLGFAAALNGGAGCALHSSGKHRARRGVVDVYVDLVFQQRVVESEEGEPFLIPR